MFELVRSPSLLGFVHRIRTALCRDRHDAGAGATRECLLAARD